MKYTAKLSIYIHSGMKCRIHHITKEADTLADLHEQIGAAKANGYTLESVKNNELWQVLEKNGIVKEGNKCGK